MRNPLIAKLEHGAFLTADDRAVLTNLTQHTRLVAPDQPIAQKGERSGTVYVLLEGLACRARDVSSGIRQITAFLMPGDLCNLSAAVLDGLHNDMFALSSCEVARIPRTAMLSLMEGHPRIAHALWWCTFVDESIKHEWFINIAQRTADRRMAHLFCELLLRCQAAGIAKGNSYDLPLSQAELADVLGISAVHVNRTLQALRAAGYIQFQKKSLTVLSPEQLMAYCTFDPAYLYLTRKHEGVTQVRLSGVGDRAPFDALT